MMPPGRKVVLLGIDSKSVWGTLWPKPGRERHLFGYCWMCTIFRNEGDKLSSEMISEAEGVTRYFLGDPPEKGIITFIDKGKVKSKRDPGFCFLKAGWEEIGYSKGGLLTLGHAREKIPEIMQPAGLQEDFFENLLLEEGE